MPINKRGDFDCCKWSSKSIYIKS